MRKHLRLQVETAGSVLYSFEGIILQKLYTENYTEELKCIN